MKLLYGQLAAEMIYKRIKRDIADFSVPPTLAAVLIGDYEPSRLYVKMKEKKAREIGIRFFAHTLPDATSQADALSFVRALGEDDSVNGILVQLPLPAHLIAKEIIAAIPLQKDVDGLREGSPFICPFPRAIVLLAESSGVNLSEKRAVVLAASRNFGKAMTAMLREKGMVAEYFVGDEREKNAKKIAAADLVVTALGRPEFLRGEYIKEGAIVIDGGIEKAGGVIRGDVDAKSVAPKAAFLSPVPGGVGPVTIACLLENVTFSSHGRKEKMKLFSSSRV